MDNELKELTDARRAEMAEYDGHAQRVRRADAARNMLDDALAAVCAYQFAMISPFAREQMQRAADTAVRMAKAIEPLLNDARFRVTVTQISNDGFEVAPSAELRLAIECGGPTP